MDFDDDNNCVITHNNITGWLIGPDPESNSAGVASADPAGSLWPHQVKSWQYASGGKLRSDPQLTVTQSFQGNVFISIKLLQRKVFFPNKFMSILKIR